MKHRERMDDDDINMHHEHFCLDIIAKPERRGY